MDINVKISLDGGAASVLQDLIDSMNSMVRLAADDVTTITGAPAAPVVVAPPAVAPAVAEPGAATPPAMAPQPGAATPPVVAAPAVQPGAATPPVVAAAAPIVAAAAPALETDASGAPWNPDHHTSNKKMTAKNRWKMKPKADRAAYDAYAAQFAGQPVNLPGAAAPAPAAAAPAPAAAAPAPAAAAPAPAAPVGPQYAQVVFAHTSAQVYHGWTIEQANSILQRYGAADIAAACAVPEHFATILTEFPETPPMQIGQRFAYQGALGVVEVLRYEATGWMADVLYDGGTRQSISPSLLTAI